MTCAANALLGVFHIAFGCCGAWVEIFLDAMCHQVGAPFEVAALDPFEEC